MYKASRWDTKKERKWTDACEPSRRHFAQRAASLLAKHDDISYHAIVAYKPNVMPYLRGDATPGLHINLRKLCFWTPGSRLSACGSKGA
ncbi:hypothetical protein C8J98_106177 [Luteibacter sp. OK325]|nr:hypothetical protein C8J98_106177 [Luteibacter sp. OK325]